MRLTRGCRAGGGVACSSLEYGGIRAATRRTPAPHGRLLLPTSPPPSLLVLFVHLRFARLSRSLISCYSLSPRNIGAVLLLLPPAASSASSVSSADSAPTTATTMTTTTTMFPFPSEGYCRLAVRLAKRLGR